MDAIRQAAHGKPPDAGCRIGRNSRNLCFWGLYFWDRYF